MTERADNPSATLARYADGPAQREAVLVDLTEPDLDLARTGDSWTIRQIVHHLADGDDIWKTCIKAALGNREGLFSLQWYWDKPQTQWAENWKYAELGVRARAPGLRLRVLPAGRPSFPAAGGRECYKLSKLAALPKGGTKG